MGEALSAPSAQGLRLGNSCLPTRQGLSQGKEFSHQIQAPWGGVPDQSHLRCVRATDTGSPRAEAQGEQPCSPVLCPLMLQKEHQILKEADFKKWLHSKLLPRGQSLIHRAEQEPQAPPWTIALSKTPKPPKRFHPSLEMRLQQMPQLEPQPSVTPTPVYKKPTVRRPKLWDISNNPATSPTTQIGYPQGIRLGVHPDPSPEHDFRRFLEVRSDGHGGARLCTVAGKQVAPVPRLPLEVIVRELYPQVRPYRMKVPQGFRPVSMRDVARKRYLGDNTFWTDTLAMNLRETFDEAFLAAVRAHQGLPTVPSPEPL